MENFARKSTPYQTVTYASCYDAEFLLRCPLPSAVAPLAMTRRGTRGRGTKMRKNKTKPLLGSILKRLFPRAVLTVVPPPITRICLATPRRVQTKTPTTFMTSLRSGNWNKSEAHWSLNLSPRRFSHSVYVTTLICIVSAEYLGFFYGSRGVGGRHKNTNLHLYIYSCFFKNFKSKSNYLSDGERLVTRKINTRFIHGWGPIAETLLYNFRN